MEEHPPAEKTVFSHVLHVFPRSMQLLVLTSFYLLFAVPLPFPPLSPCLIILKLFLFFLLLLFVSHFSHFPVVLLFLFRFCLAFCNCTLFLQFIIIYRFLFFTVSVYPISRFLLFPIFDLSPFFLLSHLFTKAFFFLLSRCFLNGTHSLRTQPC